MGPQAGGGLPVVLTRDEVNPGPTRGCSTLVCTLAYGSGLRLLEGLQRHVKDLDFGRGEITIRDGEGQKDRVTMLPVVLHQPLQEYLRRVCEQHEADWKRGCATAGCPGPSTRMPTASGAGGGSFLLRRTTSTEGRASSPP